MVETVFIYALCEPGTRTVRYIGKANDPANRLKRHLCSSVKLKTHLGYWLKGLLSQGEKPNLVVLREVPTNQWQIAEERYIRLARGCGMRLVNATDGGEGITLTPEIRAKLSAARQGKTPFKGKSHSSKTRERIRKIKLGKSLSLEHVAAISAAVSGKKHHNFGKPLSSEHRAAIRAGVKKAHGLRVKITA